MTTKSKKQKQKLNPSIVIEEYRYEQLLEMGFSVKQATALARARDHRGILVDLHQIKKVLDQGCSHELAVEIYT